MPPNGFERHTRELTRRRHHLRTGAGPAPVIPDPEVEEMWHDLQLHWLKTVPGYREVVRARVSEARKRQMLKDERIYRGIDKLGREVEGCG